MLQGPASIPARSAESSINCLSTRHTLSSSLHSPAFSRPLCFTASDARKMQQIADIAKPLIQSIFNWNTKRNLSLLWHLWQIAIRQCFTQQLGYIYYHLRKTIQTHITFFRPLSFYLQSNSSQLCLLLEARVSAQQGAHRGPRGGSNKAQPVSFSRP